MAITGGGGGLPRIAAMDEKVVMTLDAEGAGTCSRQLAPRDAIRAAFMLLREAGLAMGLDDDDAIGLPGGGCRIEPADPVTEDVAATLVLKHAGAALAIRLDATNLAEFAAAVVAASRRAG